MDEALAIMREATSHLEVISAATAAGQTGGKGVKGVQGFYAGGVVLITGGSGYMGKHLLEKLFRSCEIRKAYLLLRQKKGKSIEDRLSEILKDQAFDSLHMHQPDFKQRIVPLDGDVGQVRLGLSQDNWIDITENVSMIFHVAATVKFDEALKAAALTNVRGTREILRLARECAQLKSFVYVSTAYSHTIASQANTAILEQFYPVPVSPDFLIHMAETFPEHRIEEMTAKITHGWRNTYSFTKAVAEEVVRVDGAGLPVCIVRPAIVIGAYREPLPGWTDKRCIHGTAGIGLSLIMGLNHVILAVGDVSINLVPVDYVNNAIVVAATACGKEMVVYNVSCDRSFSWVNELALPFNVAMLPVFWAICLLRFKSQCNSLFNNTLNKLPSPRIIGDGFAIMTSTELQYKVLTLLLHYIPAGLVDMCSVVVGRKPWMVKLYKRVHKLTHVLSYFTCKNWIFDDKNTQALYQNMSETDKTIFAFDRNNIDVTKMMILWSLGLRKFVLKDELIGNDLGRKKKVIFRLVTVGLFLFYFMALFWMIKFIVGLF